jgi:hypothetical protein
MATTRRRPLFERVQAHAFSSLSSQRQATTNLHIDEHIYRKGERIGPGFQEITAPIDSILVFADDDPRANFGHACRYLLYDARNGDFHREVPARFPPIADAKQRKTLRAFHEPMQFSAEPISFHLPRPIWRCPIIIPEGTRYAILYSGMSNKRHLNDMEFLYRTLIDVYAFNPAHIYALSYDGTLDTQDGVQASWPGNNTAYRIKITGQGNRAAFEAAIDDLKTKLHALDTVLIHCNNHGDYDGVPGTSYLCTYPNWGKYYNADFSNKVAELPKFRQLLVMLEQCNSGGFNASILAKSPAAATSVASAAIESQSSYVSADGNWDPFARDWIAAQAGHTPFGTALAFNPDSDGDGKIEAEEAFAYANAVRDPRDSPNFSESSEAGGDIALGQEYIIWWWWCFLLKEALEEHQVRLPPDEYDVRLHRIQPRLAELTAGLDKRSDELRREMAAQIRELVASAFGGQPRATDRPAPRGRRRAAK